MSEDGGEDREHAPTQKKLDEARQRGEVPRSADLASAFALTGFLIALVLTGPQVVARIGGVGTSLLGRADRLGPEFLEGGGAAGDMLAAVGQATAGLFLLPVVGVVLGHLVQRSWTFTPANLAPRMSRISPLANVRQRFGVTGLGEFLKSAIKAVLAAGLLAWLLRDQLDATIGTARLSAGGASLYLVDQIRRFAVIALALSIAVGLADTLWQHLRFLARNRMSRKEITDELRESEGDPHARSHRRRRGQDLALNQMIAEVPKADVVIVNPTHYAVALKWDRGRRGAPVCVAKGVDETALRIRAAAAEAGVPIRDDPPTARAIHATVQIGQEIHPDHYRAVAAAIRFAEAMRRRARRQR